MSQFAHTTRLAPSPTGALHLGNARTFLVNYLLAVRNGWRVLMRIEDLDGPRVKRGADAQLLDELAWLGLRWEQPVVYQSQRSALYRAALERLAGRGMAYPCVCSRKDVELASAAPHAEDEPGMYSGTCRGRYASAEQARQASGRHAAWRVVTDGQGIEFDDGIHGRQRRELSRAGGDFVIYKNDGLAAYQLAVVVDDAEAGVDRIVRGDDLLDSAARQVYLRRLLGIGPEPAYWHLPLVVGPDGRRLAKRHGDTRVEHYRGLGCPAGRMLGLLGFWCGILSERRATSMDELVEHFELASLPRGQVVFGPADEDFLTQP